jgi:hypothetical protein
VNRFWKPVIEPLLDAAGASTVVEIGVDQGATTRLLLERARRIDGVVHAIDTAPAIDVAQWQAEHGDRLRLHQDRSHDVLPRIGPPDAALVDGDHNWFTVTEELRLLAAAAAPDALPPVVIAHDVGWPYGRRDMYYDPDSVPAEYRHEAALEGMLPDEREIIPWGLNYWLWNARFEGGPRNGVLTAIEDFVAASEEPWQLVVVEGFHGLGVLVAQRRIDASPALGDAIDRLRSHEFGREWAGVLEMARVRAQIETWRLMGSPRG